MTRTLLIIDDDQRLTDVLQRRFNATGEFDAIVYHQASDALNAEPVNCYGILLDMMIGDELGLDYIGELKTRFNPEHLIVMTGYASIATTVTALKRGATDYLSKPASFAELCHKLQDKHRAEDPVEPPQLLTAAQVEWEHIQRVLADNNGNVSRTAESLGLHRRSLQRKLQKFSPTKK